MFWLAYYLRTPDGNLCAWDPIRATRPNQDYQRETEDTSMNDIQTHLAGRKSGKLVKLVNIETNSYQTGGSFLKLEQDWRDSHLAYLQHKTALVRSSRPSSAGNNIIPTSHHFLVFCHWWDYYHDLNQSLVLDIDKTMNLSSCPQQSHIVAICTLLISRNCIKFSSLFE